MPASVLNLLLLVAAGGFSIRQHMMASYLRSLSSICIAQCMQYKGLPGGRQGVEGLARSPQLLTYFGTLSGHLPFQKQCSPAVCHYDCPVTQL